MADDRSNRFARLPGSSDSAQRALAPDSAFLLCTIEHKQDLVVKLAGLAWLDVFIKLQV